MSGLLTNVITIRGVEYEVSEIDGKTMREIRKRLKDMPETVEAFVAWQSCVPKLKSYDETETLPSFVIKAIANEAFRLTNGGEEEQKNG